MKQAHSIGRSTLPRLLLATAAFGTLAPAGSQAATMYWDGNGNSAGAGTTPAGTWASSGSGGSAFWTTTEPGTAATVHYTGTGHDVIFSAGSDATGTYGVTLGTSQNIHSLTFEDGNVTITPTSTSTALTLNAADSHVTVASGVNARVAAPFGSTSVGFTKLGGGTLELGGVTTGAAAQRRHQRADHRQGPGRHPQDHP